MTLTLNEAHNLLEIIEKRQKKGSIIFCSQLPVNEWHHKFNQDTLADAIIDRIQFNSHEILIQGKESMRKKRGLKMNA